MSAKLSEQAMLAALTIHRWQGQLTDRKVTSEVARQHQVSEKRAGRYNKYAIDVNAASFRAIIGACSELRTKHYFYTLPWGQDGARILTATNFGKYSDDMRHLKGTFEQAVQVFIADYPLLIEKAKRELNGLFNAADYPRNIGRKFGVEYTINNLPDADDFRVKLADDQVADIKAGIEAQMASTMAVAMKDPYQRLFAHVSRMVRVLSDEEIRKQDIKDSLISGLVELCGVLPGLNLAGDQKLEELRKQAESMVAGVSGEHLREVPVVRSAVAAKAKEIQDVMAGFMGPAEEEA